MFRTDDEAELAAQQSSAASTSTKKAQCYWVILNDAQCLWHIFGARSSNDLQQERFNTPSIKRGDDASTDTERLTPSTS